MTDPKDRDQPENKVPASEASTEGSDSGLPENVDDRIIERPGSQEDA
jgi:hypothetical protein